jgi:hypothetical protein
MLCKLKNLKLEEWRRFEIRDSVNESREGLSFHVLRMQAWKGEPQATP